MTPLLGYPIILPRFVLVARCCNHLGSARMIGTMNCTRCKTKAVLKLPRHNAAFCKDCFNNFVHDQVLKAIRSQEMFAKNDRLLVAVSGGKDSLALWAILLKLGYNIDALYVNLGIGGLFRIITRKSRALFKDRGRGIRCCAPYPYRRARRRSRHS